MNLISRSLCLELLLVTIYKYEGIQRASIFRRLFCCDSFQNWYINYDTTHNFFSIITRSHSSLVSQIPENILCVSEEDGSFFPAPEQLESASVSFNASHMAPNKTYEFTLRVATAYKESQETSVVVWATSGNAPQVIWSPWQLFRCRHFRAVVCPSSAREKVVTANENTQHGPCQSYELLAGSQRMSKMGNFLYKLQHFGEEFN